MTTDDVFMAALFLLGLAHGYRSGYFNGRASLFDEAIERMKKEGMKDAKTQADIPKTPRR